MHLAPCLRAFLVTSVLAIPIADRPAAAATLRGTISDPDGRPAPGARVLLSGPVAIVATAVTDGRGTFRFSALTPGSYELRVVLDGFRADPLAMTLAADDDREVRIPLRIAALAESVVVSASHVDVPLSRVPDSVTVVTGHDLRARQIETVADALRTVPGLTVTRSGGRGGITSLFPRGGESDFTLVLVDGIRVNAFGGGFDFAHLPVADIERIEVVRGPQSALYGSDAIGAVVQVVTRHGGPARLEGALEAGGLGTRRLVVASSGSHGPWNWGAGAERLASDGFTGIAPGTGERVTNDDYRLRQVSFSGGWRGPRENFVRGAVRIGSNERGFPGPFGSDPKGYVPGVDRISRGVNETRLLSLGAAYRVGDRIRQRIQLTHAVLDSEFTSPYGTSESSTRRVGARIQTDIAARAGLELSVGLEAQRERAGSTFITGTRFTPIPIRRRIVGYFGEARYDVGQRLFLTTGLRLEHIQREALDGDPNPFGPRPPFEAESNVSANPKFSVAYFLQPAERRSRGWTRLRASGGTGIRPPNAFEIAFTDNPSLKPERSRSLDLGVEQAFVGGAVVIEATGFFNRYDDLIVAVGRALRDASRYRTDNISNARARGLELTGAIRTAWGLHARATYTLLDTAILAVDRGQGRVPAPFAVGDPLLRRPRHQGSIEATVTRGRVTVAADLASRGGILDVEPSFGASPPLGGLFVTPGYAVVRAGAAIRLTRSLEVFARATNLFNRRYEDTLGFPALGQSAMLGIRLATRR